MKLPLIALAAVAAALLADPAQAQRGIVTTQLDSAIVLMSAQGFTPSDDPVMGTLSQGDDEEFEVELDSGSQYFVVGVCDGGCSDLDLVLTTRLGGGRVRPRAGRRSHAGHRRRERKLRAVGADGDLLVVGMPLRRPHLPQAVAARDGG